MDSVKSGDWLKNVKFKSEMNQKSTINFSEDYSKNVISSADASLTANTIVTVSNATKRSAHVSLAPSSHQPPVKPSQLGLRTIMKPANINLDHFFLKEDDTETSYLKNATAGIDGDNNMFDKGVNIENIVWPQLRKKVMKNNMTVGFSTNEFNPKDSNPTSPGADFYDQDVKVTVL